MLQVICIRSCHDHLSVHFGDDSLCSEEIVKNLSVTIIIRVMYTVPARSAGSFDVFTWWRCATVVGTSLVLLSAVQDGWCPVCLKFQIAGGQRIDSAYQDCFIKSAC